MNAQTQWRWPRVIGRAAPEIDVWRDTQPIRADLFGTERLEHHARTLAAAQPIVLGPPAAVTKLSARLKDNAAFLLGAYRAAAAALKAGQTVTPAAEWLLDNYHLVEQQVLQIADDMPPGYYRQLPKLSEGPFAGYPRVLGLAWAYVAHSDSLVSGPVLARFVRAYQQVQPLRIGELWAVAITLRIVLVENMRRLAEQITEGHRLRLAGDVLVDRVLGTADAPGMPLHMALAEYEARDLPEIMAGQMAKRLRGFDPAETPLRGWLEDRLRRQGLSIDAVVSHAQARQGASNITMRNIVTSMRLVSEMDWADFFEEVSLVDARLRDGSDFAAMDFATRNRYRSAIEVLARGSDFDELGVTEAALAEAAAGTSDVARDPGHALIGAGRAALERRIGFTAPARLRLWRGVRTLGLGGYLGAVALVTAMLLAVALGQAGPGGTAALIILGLLALLLASEAATAVVNIGVTRAVGPHPLPGLELAQGIPAQLRTLVAVPVILTDIADLERELERLEVHYLSSIGGALHYALLSDGPDAATETMPGDAALIAAATAGIVRLNARYPSATGDRFLLLHRRRLWNAGEGVWMGWERKRGKLTELNRLLRGASDTSFLASEVPMPNVPQDVRFVITLDADTRLLRDTVRRMIGKMAHPLNRARFDSARQRVIAGYGILQPRVTASLPVGRDGSLFQRIFSSPGGIEPYAAAISDVYQDLFDEGSFTGKGIYDVDAFEAAMRARVPDNTMLSHDLFEGTFARAALASDIEVVEDYPVRYDVAARRQHRWVRGDWQLLPWISGKRHSPGGVPPVGRWKMIDNLRRSLVAPMTLAALFAGWLMPLPVALAWTAAIVCLAALPRVLPLAFVILPSRAGVTWRSHLASLSADASLALAQVALGLAFLADTAWQMLDAILRTLWRLAVSRRFLLEWVTAARLGGSGQPGIPAQYLGMAGGVTLGLGLVGLAVAMNPVTMPVSLPFALLWLAAPALAQWTSRPRRPRTEAELTPDEVQTLRRIARRTWRFFETFVTPEDNFLPPDNFQETPRPVVAHRTSPTNIGLYLLSVTVARDMGWIGTAEAATRLEQTLRTMEQMPRFRGHLYNWHDTRDLRVLDPPYVSSVDSGNLAGHLIAVARACRDWSDAPPSDDALRAGLTDTLALARQALADRSDAGALILLLSQIDAALGTTEPLDTLVPLADHAVALATDLPEEPKFWIAALHRNLADRAGPAPTAERLQAIEGLARDFALSMEFGFLLDPEKKLFSIGFSVATNTLDPSCYDLLASESHLASLFAIAKGDVPTRHWFRLGRSATPVGTGSALISWSGSMFEYLMPSLVLRAPEGSVLDQTNRLIVGRQQAYGAALGIPWGISESSYNARDLEMTYQYSNFGVPGLGLKRGLSENKVLAPYATGLATMIAPRDAVQNYARLAEMGAEGRFGFYEAIDFTEARLPEGVSHAIVRSFMAHHQGMTITAIANTVQNGSLRARFHAEPMVQGVELLLQERVPRDAAAAPPRAEEVLVTATQAGDTPAVRRFDTPAAAAPTAHLLSNGDYGVMLTPTGAGYSRWNDIAVTRWRPEASQSALGSFIFARDAGTGEQWSAAVQPVAAAPDSHSAVFCEHHAAFTHHQGALSTTTEIVISSEDNAEARRVTLMNTGRSAREIDLTFYAELVLAPAAADLAHPAFSKMFVVTDYLPELGVIIATRRRRAPQDPEIWAAHIAVVEGTETAPIQIETDRARFIGRGRNLRNPAMATGELSGTVGTVLDPIFAIRRRVRVPGGGMARVTFWTMIADNSEELLDLVDRHRDPSAFDRAETLSWTQAQVQLRHLGMTRAKALEFQQLAGFVLRGDPRLRSARARIASGQGPQSGLWPMGISGDLPIILMRIDDAEDIAQVQDVLTAHEYWRMRQMAVDLVILNERASSYVQDLQFGIEAAIRAAQLRPRAQQPDGAAQGRVHAVRSDLITPEARALLLAAAAVVLVASRGSIGQQIDALPALPAAPLLPPPPPLGIEAPPALPELEFFNGIGGFAEDGREYVTILRDGQTTPAPWINVIANPGFGFQVSAEGAGHVWAENSRENQLTPWSNDPVSDPPGEAIYLHDLDTGALWTPTALPIRGPGTYLSRHGFGYSRFEHAAQGIDAEMVQFVPLDEPVKITRLRLCNTGPRPRRLSVTAYAEWVLGPSRSATARYITTEIDPATGAILCHNPWSTAFPGRTAFADLGPGATATTDRAEFLGPTGSMAAPPGARRQLSGQSGPALDPCAALQRQVTLAPGETVEILFLIGQAASAEAARDVIARMRAADPETILAGVRQHWTDLLTAVQVRSPDRAMDILLNGWLLYQTLACRIWARAAFYQASGAYGFRDQLQDGMALTFARPELTRAHLLRAAGRQFPEGDLQHWWLPHSGQGVRTRISDDRVWLGYCVAHYVGVSGDTGVLDEMLPFLEGPDLQPGAHDDFFLPGTSDEQASVFEHCARGLDQAVALTGTNGMPLIGTGDWNDGMNRVGEGGSGTSVWLGWLLIATIRLMAPLADGRDPVRAARWRAHAESVRTAIEQDGWDGEWYRRGTFDDGTPLGSAGSEECRIDSIAQSWAVLSGAADPARAASAMAAVTARLIRPDPGLALLFTPPFDHTTLDPGYIKGYPPGLRENGGQYSHAAMWAVLAQSGLKNGDAAGALFALLNPINHALTPEAAQLYKVEPYVIAADVYSTPPHDGRGGWTWYTGSAAWMHRAGIEGLLGLTRAGDTLRLDPCFPKRWPRLEATVRIGEARIDILIENPDGTGHGIVAATLDGNAMDVPDGPFVLPLSDRAHRLHLRLGQVSTESPG